MHYSHFNFIYILLIISLTNILCIESNTNTQKEEIPVDSIQYLQ